MNGPLLLMLFHRPAVGGCEYTQPNDPGNLQLDWLDVQLGVLRDKGIKVGIVCSLSAPQIPVPGSTQTGRPPAFVIDILIDILSLLGMVDGACSSHP